MNKTNHEQAYYYDDEYFTNNNICEAQKCALNPTYQDQRLKPNTLQYTDFQQLF